MPKFSVIIPIYNSEQYLKECIDSVLKQTLTDFEILCVDDGSSDNSYEIIHEYGKRDKRIRVLRQKNTGAGTARNNGIDNAKGHYLFFLDSDDFIEPSMLKKTYHTCLSDCADICFFKTRLVNATNGHRSAADWMLKTELLPRKVPFTSNELGDNIFYFTTPVPWNRIYRRDFIKTNGLRFQALKRANDMFFTHLSLSICERITVIKKPLIYHRIGLSSNLQSKNHETPLDFFTALTSLKTELEKLRIFAKFERAFVNETIRHCIYNLSAIRDCNAFINLFDTIKDNIIPFLNVHGRDKSYYLTEKMFNEYTNFVNLQSQEYLFNKYTDKQKELDHLKQSTILRIGRMLISLQRKVKLLRFPF